MSHLLAFVALGLQARKQTSWARNFARASTMCNRPILDIKSNQIENALNAGNRTGKNLGVSQFHATSRSLRSLMVVDTLFPLTSKRRRRITNISSMDKLADINERFGREIHVFETSSVSRSPTAAANNEGEETDDFYEFTAEDYYRILATKKEDKFLKTRKIREAEEAAHRSRITKAVIRVRFPDDHTLEATFHPSETIQSLIDLLAKVIAQPEQPFYIYTTPPKKLIKDISQDFYTAGFCPGAIVYFSYDIPKGDSTLVGHTGPYLREEVMSLKGLDVDNDQGQPSEPVQSAPEPVEATQPAVEERKPAEKKLVKPKWLKL